MGYRDYATAKGHIVDTNGHGDFTTIASALTAASSGQTIFIMPGTYTENLTLKAGVNLTAYDCDALNGNVSIVGKCTLSTAGTVDISGIRLTTNSDFCLAVTGSVASIVNLKDCFINCSNNTGISYTSSSGSSLINIINCRGDLGTTGIGIWSCSGAGSLNIYASSFTNSGSSTSASTTSATSVNIYNSVFFSVFSTSSTGTYQIQNCTVNAQSLNTTCLTTAGTGGSSGNNNIFNSGSASALSIGAGSSLNIGSTSIFSTNTNAITGAGTLDYAGISFTSSGNTTINTTNQVGGTLQGGVVQAPSSGFLGEQIRSYLDSGSAVSLSNATAKTITSISLTPGVWDISSLVVFQPAATTSVTNYQTSISTTNNTIAGNPGDSDTAYNITANVQFQVTATVPAYRQVVTTTTTYYLIGFAAFSVSTMTAYGRISATRVG